MKPLTSRHTNGLGKVLLVCSILLVAAFALAANWVHLGSKRVSDRMDHDVVIVNPNRTDFTSIRIAVRGHAVAFRKVVVHFGNGSCQQVELRDVIPAGGESRIIDLEGRDRTIRKIELWYEAKSIGSGGAVVHVTAKR